MKLYSRNEDKDIAIDSCDLSKVAGWFFIDVETNGTQWRNNQHKVFGIAFGFYDKGVRHSYFLDIREECETLLNEIKRICADENICKVNHYIKFDIHMLMNMGFVFRNIIGTEVLAKIFDEQEKRTALLDIALDKLGIEQSDKTLITDYFKERPMPITNKEI